MSHSLSVRRALWVPAVAVTLLVALLIAPASAQTGGTKRASAEARTPMQELHDAATQRSDLLDTLTRLDRRARRLVTNQQQASSDDRHLRRRSSAVTDRTIAVIEQRRVDLRQRLATIDDGLAGTAVWPEHGLEFGVFPVAEVTEFVNSWGAPRSGGRGHKGTDILAPYGTPLYAIEDGVLERYSNSSLGGLGIYLLGDSGARYFYGHLSQFGAFAEGARIRAGDVVGLNGDSGNAGGTPHLHIQWAPSGGEAWENPFPLLDALWKTERRSALPTR